MPAKKKPNQAVWHECIGCKCTVGFRDLSKHKEECGSQLTHGYVKGGDAVLVVSAGKFIFCLHCMHLYYSLIIL